MVEEANGLHGVSEVPHMIRSQRSERDEGQSANYPNVNRLFGRTPILRILWIIFAIPAYFALCWSRFVRFRVLLQRLPFL